MENRKFAQYSYYEDKEEIKLLHNHLKEAHSQNLTAKIKGNKLFTGNDKADYFMRFDLGFFTLQKKFNTPRFFYQYTPKVLIIPR